MIALLLLAASVPAPAVGQQAAAARAAGRLDAAVRLYRQGVAASPRWAEGWWYLGTIHYERDQYVPCRDAFRKFVALEAKSAPGFALLGLCEFHSGDFAAALQHMENAGSLGLPAGEKLTSVAQYHTMLLQTKAANFERALQLGTLLSRLPEGETPDVIAATGIAALRQPIFPQELDAGDRELVFKLGRAMLLAGQRRAIEAKKVFEEIVAAYPTRPNVNYAYASFLLASEPDRGIDELEKELAIQPDHLPSLISLAAELIKRGDLEKALVYSEKAVRVAPENFPARATHGRVLVEMDRIPEGTRELEYAVKLAPDSPQTRFALASAYAKAGRKEDAARERAEFVRLKRLATPGAGAPVP